jgi:hypothetical protein
VFPGVCPCAVVHRVAHVVILDGFAVIGSQQVAPVTVAVGVSDRICGALGAACRPPWLAVRQDSAPSSDLSISFLFLTDLTILEIS